MQVNNPPAEHPSKIFDRYWLYAHRTQKQDEYPLPTPFGGKWLLFAPWEQLDVLWKHIKHATKQGLLGGSAKVSTAKPNQHARDPAQGVICVYTYDARDKEDLQRIKQQLLALGCPSLEYKTNQATREGAQT